MGPIAYLWHRTLGGMRTLRPGLPGLPELFVVLYAAVGLSAISIGLGEGESPSRRAANGVTTDSAAFRNTPPLSFGTGRHTPVATQARFSRTAGIRHSARALATRRVVKSVKAARRSPPPREPQPEAPYERPPLRADPPPSEPLVISGVDVSVSASGARIAWMTNFAATGQSAYGVGGSPSIWTPLAPSDVAHQTAFANLRTSTNYGLWLQATDEWGRTASTELQVKTLPPESPTNASASTSGGSILVNGEPFFPLALWNVCPSEVSRRIDDGINLFMGDGCGEERALLARLRGGTFAVTDAANGLSGVPGLIGWTYPDELDGRLAAPPSHAELKQLAVHPPAGLISFLTLTNHFYSGSDPLPLGRALYPQLAALANVLGFDLYPLQNWCRDDRFDVVYKAQRELETLADGKPTYQWIEARQMDCAAGSLDPTATSLRAETWLAIAGGADGIGYFPNDWRSDVGAEIRSLNSTITELAPALLSEPRQADSNQDAVKVGARLLNGATYVIAVNSGRVPVQASIHVSGLAGRTVTVLDKGRQLTASNDDILTDSFDPLAVHIYVAAPPAWSATPTAP